MTSLLCSTCNLSCGSTRGLPASIKCSICEEINCINCMTYCDVCNFNFCENCECAEHNPNYHRHPYSKPPWSINDYDT